MNTFRPTSFQLMPPVVKNIIIINALVFLAQNVFDQTGDLTNLFALHDIRSYFFKPHQIITHIFMHGSIGHIFFNMFAVWMFGAALENYFGSKKFLIFYMVSGLGAALLHLITTYVELTPLYDTLATLPVDQQVAIAQNPLYNLNVATVGASGAVFGCLAAFGVLFPNHMIYLYFFIPIRAKWFVILYGAAELYLGIQNAPGDNVAHFAHLGGAIFGFIFAYLWKKNRFNNRWQ